MADGGFMNSFEDAKESGAAGDVAILAGSAIFTTALLSGISGYRNAIDPTKGMPKWKIGLDAAVMLAGLGGAFLLEDSAAIASLGAGIAGACSVTNHYATVGGAYVAMALGKAGPHPNPNPAVKGHGDKDEIHQGGVGSMSDRQRTRYEAYLGR